MNPNDPLWYKDAILYELHVKAFADSNDDGVGDFAGLMQKLDYLQDLGVTALWILPFYPSPLRDDGYDIADYRSINPAYGTMRDFRRFVRAAHRRGLKVITELVMNHTSDQHPWFRRAQRARPGTSRRNYYVWSDTDARYQGTRIIFTDTEVSNWAWDPVAQAYYWHRFFSHQPDLNFENPRVVDAMKRVMRFWLEMGVDGLRLDAVPYLREREGTSNENLPETHEVIRELRAWLDAHFDNRMFLAEANQWPEDVRPYFGDGDECHMGFHFPLMPRIYMALAQEDRHPITDIIRQTPELPEICQWAIFLRNHDELTLEMVTDSERDYLWRFYASDSRARINLGIRRRLAPLLDNDRRKIELLKSLLMSMPGTPVVYYGDEIGMGDNIFLGDRDSVRTPMQWTPDRNGGFSRADPARLYLPPIMDPVYGYQAVNVEAQARSPSSLLNWMKRLMAVRRANLAFGRGTLEFLYPGNRKILAYLRQYQDQAILCVANLSRSPQPVELDLAAFKGRVPIELLGGGAFPDVGDLPYLLTLPGYGFYWFVLAQEAQAPSWHEPAPDLLPELTTLVVGEGWASVMDGEPRRLLERRILPEYLPKQRWFGAKDAKIESIELEPLVELPGKERPWLIARQCVRLAGGSGQFYVLPLGLAWESGGIDPITSLLPQTVARVRRGPRLGVVYDCAADEGFVRALVQHIADNAEIRSARGGSVRCMASKALALIEGWPEMPVKRLTAEQSNTSVVFDDAMILKLYRRLQPGIHPEVEVGRHLAEVANYQNTPAFLGACEYRDERDEPTALAILQGFVQNQGDGWRYALNYLERFLEEADLLPEKTVGNAAERHALHLDMMRRLGTRTAELHRAFAVPTRDPDFRPEPVGTRDLQRWRTMVRNQTQKAMTALRQVRRGLSGAALERADRLLAHRRAVSALIDRLLPERVEAAKTRYHGDLHLGQVLVAKNDFYIIDFEGEPVRPLAERRMKHSPLRDVAGLLRSFSYAGSAALRARAEIRPEASEALRPVVEEWERLSAVAFTAGYEETIGDCVSYPRDSAVAKNLVALFMLEKAMYEIGYEAANRPDWVGIPVEGVLRLLESAEEPVA